MAGLLDLLLGSQGRTPDASPVGPFPGMVRQGNIDLAKRPKVKNKDGSVSTVRSMSFGTDDGEVLVPTVSPDGRILSDQQAIDRYNQTGENLGIFDSPEHADEYAQALHGAQDRFYAKQGKPMAGILDLLSGNNSQPSAPRNGGASDFLRRLAPAIAMIDPRNAQLGAGLMAMNADRDERAQKQQNQNATAGWLQRQGMGAEEASYLASDPAALRAWYGEWKSGGKPEWTFETIYDDQGREQKAMVDKKTGKFNVIGGTKSNLLSPEEVAQKKEIAAAGRSEINLGEKLPTGYMWKDPENPRAGVAPLPGGPATQLPSEAAGRLGLADSFLQNFDKIKEKVVSGQVTGVIDRYRAGNDSSSEGAETYRQIQTGVDSLQRMLTGAGMPASEAEQYAFRYLPGYTDNAQSAAIKLGRLKNELESVQKKVLQGRTSEPLTSGGGTDYKTKYGLD